MSSVPRDRHFVVIGAQKCGTTTLDEDLRDHPGIWLAEKDRASLLDCDGTTAQARACYWEAFERAPVEAMTGEVTTFYSKLPLHDAVTPARRIFDTLKVVYIVRDPVQRVISHHRHRYAEGRAPADIGSAIRQIPALIHHSRYAMQLEPWVRAFGMESIHVIRFEDYLNDREGAVGSLHEFLGLRRHLLSNSDVALNTADIRRVPTGGWRQLQRSWAYRSLVRPLVPINARRRILRQVLPKPTGSPPKPEAAILRRLVEELQPEVERLAMTLGTESWWDLADWINGAPPTS